MGQALRGSYPEWSRGTGLAVGWACIRPARIKRRARTSSWRDGHGKCSVQQGGTVGKGWHPGPFQPGESSRWQRCPRKGYRLAHEALHPATFRGSWIPRPCRQPWAESHFLPEKAWAQGGGWNRGISGTRPLWEGSAICCRGPQAGVTWLSAPSLPPWRRMDRGPRESCTVLLSPRVRIAESSSWRKLWDQDITPTQRETRARRIVTPCIGCSEDLVSGFSWAGPLTPPRGRDQKVLSQEQEPSWSGPTREMLLGPVLGTG